MTRVTRSRCREYSTTLSTLGCHPEEEEPTTPEEVEALRRLSPLLKSRAKSRELALCIHMNIHLAPPGSNPAPDP